MIELCCECLPVWRIRLGVFSMSYTGFRVNLHFLVAGILRNSLLERDAVSEVLRDCNGI